MAAVGVGIVGISLLFISFAATSTVKLYLAPATKSVNIGDSFTVKVKMQSDQQLRYVKAYVNFPASKLQVTSISAAGSDFPTKSEETFDNTAGQVKFTRSSSNNRTGTLEIASITFKAKQSGTATVSFDSSSAAASNQYYPYPNLLTATAGGTYTIAAPTTPSPPPPTGGSSGSTGGTGSSSGTTAVTPSTTALKTSAPAANNPTAPTADTTTPSDASLEASTDPNFSVEPGAAPSSPDGTETTAAPKSRHRSPVTAIIAGLGVLVGLGAIGGAIVLNRRRPKLSLPPQEDLTTEQVEAEMNSSLLPRNDADQPKVESDEQPLADAASEAQSSTSDEVSSATEDPSDDQPSLPEAEESEAPAPPPIAEQPAPDTSPPEPTLQTENNLKVDPDEPKDMFDVAEEQFHYDEKFKTPKPKPKK